MAAPATIPAAVAAVAARLPDKPFLILERSDGSHALTFGQLHAQARRHAAVLAGSGVRPGDTVVLLLTTHPELAPAFLGAMIAGAIPSIFPSIAARQHPELFWAQQDAALAKLDVRLVLSDTEGAAKLAERLPRLAGRVLDLDLPLAEAAATLEPHLDADGTAFLQHSSGTTGLKKGVMLTHAMVLRFAAAQRQALQIEEADLIASWLPLYHDMGLIGSFVLPMLLGLTAVHLDPFEWVLRPPSLLDAIERHRATLCWLPNFAFHLLVRTAPRHGRWDLSSLRAVIDCSEGCKPETLALFNDRFAASGLRPGAVQASYGLAENVFAATQTRPGRQPRIVTADLEGYASQDRIRPPRPGAPSLEFLSCGAPIPGTRLAILGPDGVTLPDRAVGEITLTSPYLFGGYFRSDLADGRLSDGWFRTGDMGFLDAGELFVAGRRDESLTVNGKTLYATDIEFAVSRHCPVKPGRCVAIGPYNPRLGSQSLVVIAESDRAPEDQAAIGRSAQAVIQSAFGLAPFHVWIVAPGWLLKSTSGKVVRGGNEAKYLAAHPAQGLLPQRVVVPDPR